jgi:hypothetical protein
MVRTLVMLGLLASLAACGSDTPPPPPAKTERTRTVFDDQIKTMDKAQAVEDQQMERKRKLDEQLDDGG